MCIRDRAKAKPKKPRAPPKPRAPKVAAHWQLLGLTPRATIEEIKGAYRRMAMQRHPDRGGSSELFRELGEAYNKAMNAKGVRG